MSLTLSTHSFPCHLFVCQSRIYPLTHPSIHLPNKPWPASYPSKHLFAIHPFNHSPTSSPIIHHLPRYPSIHATIQPCICLLIHLSIIHHDPPVCIHPSTFMSTHCETLSSALSRGGISSLQEPSLCFLEQRPPCCQTPLSSHLTLTLQAGVLCMHCHSEHCQVVYSLFGSSQPPRISPHSVLQALSETLRAL